MTYLHAGSVLHVDLSGGTWRAVPSERYARDYVGGHGLGVGLLFESDAARPGVRSGGSACCLAAGALAGTMFPGCGSTAVTWTSPGPARTGRAHLAGGWAAELKQAGWDAVVLEGRADRPVYVSVRNETVELRDAGEVWGATCGEAEDRIQARLDSPDARVACIGPAGEQQAACATLHGDLGGADGGPGCGAAFGAMNCKAVVVRGTKGIRLADTAAFLEVALSAHEALRASSYHKQVHGPETPDLPRLWRRRRAGCACCPVSCRDSYAVPGHGGVVLPREARTGLWPELRRRDAGLWFELARQCEQDGVDALSALTTVRRLAARGELDLPAARAAAGAPADAGGREAVRRILRAAAERGAHRGRRGAAGAARGRAAGRFAGRPEGGRRRRRGERGRGGRGVGRRLRAPRRRRG